MARKLAERLSSITLLVLFVLAGATTGARPSWAQAPPGAPTIRAAPPRAQEPFQPQVIKFDPGGISLLEAVGLTLQHEPTIKLQDAAARFQEGAAQEQTGFFDLSLLGDVSYQYRVQELSESRKETEQEKRDRLQEIVNENRADAERADVLLRQLQLVRDAPPGSAQVARLVQIDPSLAAQLQIMDALIAGQPDPAKRNELIRLRQDFIVETIADVQQAGQLALEQYRDTGQRLVQLGSAPADEVFYNGSFDVGFSKAFRNGITFQPFFSAAVEGTNFKGKPRDTDFGGKGLQDLFTFRLGFNATLPLVRGRGVDATGAAERAALIGRDASRLDVEHQTAVSVLNTILAYWDLRATHEQVEAARRSVEIEAKLVELTQGLITAGELPAIELVRAQAGEARARARLQDLQRALYEARVALATTIGVAVTDDEATLPRARDEFPPLPDARLLQQPELVGLTTEASKRRRDLRAAATRENSGRVLERGAEANLGPRVDFVGSAWYTALDERMVSRAIDRWVGPSTTVGLQLERPLGNNLLRGQLVQREADTRQLQIASVDLGRRIRLAVLRTAGSLQEVIGRVQQAQAAVDFYRKTIDAEIERFRIGESTLIDTILTEAQQTEALLALAAARQDLAKLVAQLRFESGMLVPDGAPIAAQDLVTVPRVGGGQP